MTRSSSGGDEKVESVAAADRPAGLSRRHLRVGWWQLLVFLSLGLCLEGLHGFKAIFYLGIENEARRLMWTLSHAHGTLLALIQIAFAGSLSLFARRQTKRLELASRCLLGAAILMPLGFFLGGLFTHGGDPGLGIFLVLPGGLLLFIGVLLTARDLSRS